MFILDLMLPGTDGFEICKKIREEKNTPILMVSAKKDDIDKIRGLGLGAIASSSSTINTLLIWHLLIFSDYKIHNCSDGLLAGRPYFTTVIFNNFFHN